MSSSIFQQTSAPEDGYLYNARVVVKGSGVVSFTNETSIDFFSSSRNNHPHIFIQTDKAAYKTGQKGIPHAMIQVCPILMRLNVCNCI